MSTIQVFPKGTQICVHWQISGSGEAAVFDVQGSKSCLARNSRGGYSYLVHHLDVS